MESGQKSCSYGLKNAQFVPSRGRPAGCGPSWSRFRSIGCANPIAFVVRCSKSVVMLIHRFQLRRGRFSFYFKIYYLLQIPSNIAVIYRSYHLAFSRFYRRSASEQRPPSPSTPRPSWRSRLPGAARPQGGARVPSSPRLPPPRH